MERVKAGLRSSEFWLALVAAVLPVLNQHLGLGLPVEAILSIAGVAASYILGRSWVKAKQ